jgi:hypothetical protein
LYVEAFAYKAAAAFYANPAIAVALLIAAN